MKILYSADNRLGAAHQLQNFVKHTSHEVKVAAYPRSGRLLPHIDWNLDAAKNNFKLRQDIETYYPDLVLIDGDPIVANIAAQLDIPILYCSSLHLLDGLIWPRSNRGYSSTLEKVRRKLTKMPAGVAKLIYSPFGDLNNPPDIKNGFEWIQPYHLEVTSVQENCYLSLLEDHVRINKFDSIVKYSRDCQIINEQVWNKSYPSNLSRANGLLIEGATRHLADAIYNNKKVCIVPEIKDAETSLNAILCSRYQLGVDLGQIELIGRGALEKIEKAFTSFTPGMIVTSKKYKKLHERIDELWECM